MSDEETEGRISGHYGWSGLMERIEQELRQHGIDPQRVTVDQLAPVDNYHSFRLAGTLALARLAAITGADRVLDVGGGIGGPARQLAHRFGCQVTVLDLTPEYCAVGETLTRWTRLTDKVSFVCGNALALPFPDGSFDVVWTQHASMNIPDKARLYSDVARVVRRGGRFALFDVLAGPHQPIYFPVPWASDQSFNFLQSPEDTRALISQAGFREMSWITGQELQAELEKHEESGEYVPATGGLNPGLLNGPDGPRMGANVQRNSAEGRIVWAMGLFERI
ncbi:MAG: class I SAM-dependent methyltransferase [Ktedonobacterales bacterium]